MSKYCYKKLNILLLTFIFLSVSRHLFADVPRTLYVMNGTARTLSKMNMETGAIQNDFISIGQWPNQILSFNNMLYVVNSGTNDIMVIDPQTNGNVQNIAFPQGSNPYYMAFVGSNKAYVTNLVSNSVSVVDVESATVLKNIKVGTAPQGILVVENLAFVTNTGGYPAYSPSTVSIIDVLTDSVIQTLDVPANPQDMAVDPYGRIHVMCTGNYYDIPGCVVVIDRWAPPTWTPAVVDTIDIGGTPGDIVITPSGKGYCSSYGMEPNGHLYSFDALADTVIQGADNPLPVGFGAMRLLYDQKENALWISNQGNDSVQKYDIENETVMETFAFGLGAQDMAIIETVADTDPWADRVVFFNKGSNSNNFGLNYFPENVLGPPDPDPNLSAYSPSSSPQEILSLGESGEIVLEFTNNKIVDGPGVDFTVFENPFISFFDGSVAIEAGIVSVSQDGQEWYTFPYDTTDMSGLAGVTPTADNQHPTDPAVSGGDQFDLADLGVDWVTFVKITDLGAYGSDKGDFDLDAVVAVNSMSLDPTFVADNNNSIPNGFELLQNYPNPFNPSTTITFKLDNQSFATLNIYSINGELVKTLVSASLSPGVHRYEWNGKNDSGQPVSSGMYLARLEAHGQRMVKKMNLIR